MKKLGIAALITLMLVSVFFIDTFDLFGGKSAAAVEGTEVSSVVVTGEGIITVKPDIAYIQLGVNTKNEDAQIAQNENKALMDAVIKALKGEGLSDDELQTIQYSIYQSYDYNRPSLDGEEGTRIFEVNNIIKVTLKDINAVGTIIDTASNAGANVVQSVSFDSTQKESVYLDALKLAMNGAEAKAESIMSTFNKKPSTPFKVYESAGYSSGPIYAEFDAVKSASTPIQAGELEIRANVSVEYQY